MRNLCLAPFAAIGAIISAIAVNAQTSQPNSLTHSQGRIDLSSPRVTAPFPPEVYAQRRAALMDKLGKGVAIIHSADSVGVDGSRQNPDFAYLTGVMEEAGAMLLLFPGYHRDADEILLLAPYTPENDVWTGERLPLGELVRDRTGVDRVVRTSSLAGFMGVIAKQPTLHFLGPIVGPDRPTPKALSLYRKIAERIPGSSIENRHAVLPQMRSRKESRELDLMKKAINATIEGHRAGMKAVRPSMTEYNLQDVIERKFKDNGAHRVAFPSIVASGPNSAILHYERNDRTIGDGELVVVDIGAEYQFYAADITRTYPSNGQFTDRQREIYDLVLKAQSAAVAKLKAGVLYREEVMAAAEAVFREAGYRDYFLHGLGHFVGLQVHDSGDYLEPLPEGAVITIEPGLYLADEGFGVRIEDQYLITKKGAVHLTADLPRTSDEIEAFMAGAAGAN